VAQTNEFVQLATGLNFFEETTQAWLPSREAWEVYDGGPSAPFALHQEMLDKVTFGNVIAEPNTCALSALGALLLAWRWRRVLSR
jgi:hypothetical protein